MCDTHKRYRLRKSNGTTPSETTSRNVSNIWNTQQKKTQTESNKTWETPQTQYPLHFFRLPTKNDVTKQRLVSKLIRSERSTACFLRNDENRVCCCCCCCCWPQMMFIWKLSCYRVYVGMRCQSDATHSTHRYWQLHFNQLAPQRSMDHFTAGFSKLLGIHSTRLWLWNVRPVPEWHRQ